MWNAYAVVMMMLYAPPAKGEVNKNGSPYNKTLIAIFPITLLLAGGGAGDSGIQRGSGGSDRVKGQEGDPAALQKFLNKTSQE